jgi:(p)ppGpp synthase/HD superfamily hydrolase
MHESRVRHLELNLRHLGHRNALRAFDFVVAEMCTEKGFSRHSGAHYYYHCVDVAQDLLNNDITYEPCITAALLHDAEEDIKGVTNKMIAEMFGEEVAIYVGLLTKNQKLDYKIHENMVEYLKGVSKYVWTSLIKTADRKHNFSTLREATFEKRMRQAIETETYYIPAFKDWRNKYPRYSAYFFGAKTAIEPHLWAIKDYQAEIDRLTLKSK